MVAAVALREHWKQKRDWRKRCSYLELWSKTKNDRQHYKSRGGDDSAIWDRRWNLQNENWKLKNKLISYQIHELYDQNRSYVQGMATLPQY